ncbi:hypothetical protein GCM10023088_13420 [Actinomadura verrucosospora]
MSAAQGFRFLGTGAVSVRGAVPKACCSRFPVRARRACGRLSTKVALLPGEKGHFGEKRAMRDGTLK